LLNKIKSNKNIMFKGIFSHDGHCYNTENLEAIKEILRKVYTHD